MGVAQLGGVIKFIPNPVIVGFTSGIAVIIWVGQWKDFFGLQPLPSGIHFHEKAWALLKAFPELDGPTTAIGLLALAAVFAGNRVLALIPGLRRLPAPLFAMLLAVAVQKYFDFSSVATIGTAFGGIPRTLPSLEWPDLSLAQILQLIGPAFTIALLGAIESLLTAVVADGMSGTRHNSNQELIGQGAANILSPLFGGFAATGAVARTATSIRNGATSPLAGVVHSRFPDPRHRDTRTAGLRHPACGAFSYSLFCGLEHVRRAAFLAPDSDCAASDKLLLLMTFGLTVFVDLVVAVNVGVVIAALLFMRRMAESVSVQEQVFGTATPNDAAAEPADALRYRTTCSSIESKDHCSSAQLKNSKARWRGCSTIFAPLSSVWSGYPSWM